MSGTPTVYLHIGTPKGGTSYLQGRLAANRPALAEQGFLWAHPWNRQVRAARDVRALRPGQRLEPDGPWSALAREILDWHGSAALISMEWLVRCHPYQIEAAVASLSPARVEVVCIARDLARTVPAAWQEGTQNFRTWTWDDFLRAITGERGADHPNHREFWSQHDLVDVFRRWSVAVPLEQAHLITIPPAGQPPELLWDRFCQVIGLDGSSFPSPPGDNASLGVVSAQVMRRLNVTLREQGLSRADYTRLGKHVLGKLVLPQRRQQEGKIKLPDDARQWLATRSEAMLTELEGMPINLVGDVSELAVADAATGRDPNSVSDAEMVDAAIAALAGLVAWTAQHQQQTETSSVPSDEAAPRRRVLDAWSEGTAKRAIRRSRLRSVRRLTRRARRT